MTRGLPLFVALLLGGSFPALAASVFTTRPDDPGAIYLTAPDFGVRGDGTSDDSAAIQAAIDKADDSCNGGIVFVPAGRYRLTRTIYVWRGVRVSATARRGRCSCSPTTRPGSRRASA